MAYYLVVWIACSQKADTPVVRYSPPEGMGPAACRYILNMGWDPKGFTAAIVNLAAKGFVTIAEFDRDKFKLTRTDKSAQQAKLTPGETAVALRLFGKSLWTSFVFRSEHHAITDSARTDLRRSLKEDFENIYFTKNKTLLTHKDRCCAAAALGAITAVSDAGIAVGAVAAGLALLGYALYPLALGAWTGFGRGEGGVISFSFSIFVAIGFGTVAIDDIGRSVAAWLSNAPAAEIGLIAAIIILTLCSIICSRHRACWAEK